MEQFIKSTKYPKSISGKQCLGPCYKKNTKILHPTYLNVVTNKDNFCPTNRNETTINGKKVIVYTDVCNDVNVKEIDKTNSYDLLFPYVDFNPELFLNIFYNINNFGEVIEWINNNKYQPIDSKERVLNLGYDSFKEKIDIIEISDNRIIDFIYDLFSNKYFNKIIIPLFEYIDVTDKYTKFGLNDKKDTNETIIIKTNYIKKNILNLNNISNFIKAFFNKKIELNVNNTYSSLMVDGFIKYIINDIKQKFIK
jgi:hypothetical protein